MSAKTGDTYYLATGSAGEKRLALLEQVYGPDAARIMLSIGIPRGGRVADLGCGTGNSLRWFAGQVVSGRVFRAEPASASAEHAPA